MKGLRDFVPFARFKKREKHSWRSVTFSKAVGRILQLCEKYFFHVF